MEKDFDFNSIGKRMPYQVPDGFFDQLEKDVWKEIKEEPNQGSVFHIFLPVLLLR